MLTKTVTAQADLPYEAIHVGTRASFLRKITDQDIDEFALLSGDTSPLHTDHEYAADTAYGQRVVHGMFLASLVSRLLGMQLPGRRSLCLSMQFDFVAPVYADDEVEVIGVVTKKQDATQTLVIRIEVVAMPGRTVVRGKAIVRVLSRWIPLSGFSK